MGSLMQILLLVLDVVWFFVLAQVIMSWLVQFEVLNLRQPIVYQIWSGLQRILEPIYAPIRRILPPMGGLDFTPLVVILVIAALRIIIRNNIYAF
ncbi:YggT family protein [Algicella marina]|uniref:YggT family protein n=1 Tax=Algicella marina TaxID=2683284 RepID=A0A6P1STJ3_9RHOB|nr:YggT family protein [Algicella marina]QHQ33748.1 YggT family protein [Algicella marina]